MVKRKLTVGGLIGHLASVSHFHSQNIVGKYTKKMIYLLFCLSVYPTCNFFLEYDPRFSVAPSQNVTSTQGPESPSDQRTFTFLTKRYNVVLSFRTTRVRLPLPRNPSPLQYPTSCVQYFSVRSLLRQPRSALEAGPSEAHAISFDLTPIPCLHWKGCAFSSAFPPLPKG